MTAFTNSIAVRISQDQYQERKSGEGRITAASLYRIATRVPDAPVVGNVPDKRTEGIVNIATTRFHFRRPALIPLPVGAKYFRSLIGKLNSDAQRRRAVRRQIDMVEFNLKF